MDLQLTLEAFIYNENLASWEPLIEPLEDIRIGGYRPYQLHAKVAINNISPVQHIFVDVSGL